MPNWFQGYDFIIDFLVLFILVVIAYNFKKVNLYTSSRKSKVFEFSFYLLILSFLIKDVINLFLYISYDSFGALGSQFLVHKVLHSVLFYEFGIFMYRMAYLIAFFLIYKHLLKENCKYDIFGIFTMIVIAYFSVQNFILFYLTLTILLLSISIFYYNRIYRYDLKNKSKRYVQLFLIFIGLSKFVVMLFLLNGVLLGMLFELLGYLFLILSFKS